MEAAPGDQWRNGDRHRRQRGSHRRRPGPQTAPRADHKLETRPSTSARTSPWRWEATQADPTDLVAKAAREATLLPASREKKANKLAWVQRRATPDMSDLFPKLDNVRPIYGPLWGVVTAA